jgi:hypothetical protein
MAANHWHSGSISVSDFELIGNNIAACLLRISGITRHTCSIVRYVTIKFLKRRMGETAVRAAIAKFVPVQYP